MLMLSGTDQIFTSNSQK